jgi:hypothetical protein
VLQLNGWDIPKALAMDLEETKIKNDYAGEDQQIFSYRNIEQ